MAERLRRHGALAAAVILAALLLSWNVTRPWIGYGGGDGAMFGVMARNYLHYGYGETSLGPVTNVGPSRRDEFRYYTHHPVMLPLLMSLSYRFFGISEASARLVPILFTLGGLLVWHRILLMQWGRATAAYGVLLMALMPMTTVFGATITPEPPSLFFVLLTLWCYLRWRKSEGRAEYLAMLVAAFVGTQSGWPAYVAALMVMVHVFLDAHAGRALRAKILGLPLAMVAGFGVFVGHLWVINGAERLVELYGAFANRAFLDPLPNTPSAVTRLTLNLVYGGYLFTPIVLGLSAWWLVALARRLWRGEGLGRDAMVVVLLLGLTYPIVFSSGSVHPFRLLHLAPFLSVSAALVLAGLHQRANGKGRVRMIALPALVLGVFVADATVHWAYLDRKSVV